MALRRRLATVHLPRQALLLASLLVAGVPTPPAYAQNLLVNGDAETPAGIFDPIPGWTVPDDPQQDNATLIDYGFDGYPALDSPGPVSRGSRFFTGGISTTASLSQIVDVSAATAGTPYTLCGFLGGFETQDDYATLTAQFRDAQATATGAPVQIGPVLASERNSVSGLCLRSASGNLPAGTSQVLVTVRFENVTGQLFNDGYADNLTFVLATACPEGTLLPPCSLVQPTTTTTSVDTTTTTSTTIPPLAARFTATPNPSCTGTPMRFDAGASTTPNGPITRYRFEYVQREGLLIPETVTRVIAEGAAAAVDYRFTWNRQTATQCPATPFTPPRFRALREDVDVVLTITDASGAQATATERLGFAAGDSCTARTACPGEGTVDPDVVFLPSRFSDPDPAFLAPAGRRKPPTVVATLVDCVSVGGCLGEILVRTAPRGAGTARERAVARARRQVDVASGPFELAEGESGVVEVPLTPAGRKLLRKRKKLKAVVTLTSLAPSGAVAESTETVQIRRVRAAAPP